MTPAIDSFRRLLTDQVRQLYDAEQLFVGALADLAGCASDRSLSAFLQNRLADTTTHLTRIEAIFTALGVPPVATPAAAVRGLIRDSERQMANVFGSSALRDAAVAGLALVFVHYGIAGYTTALAHAEVLGLDDVIQRLDAMLVDELAADRALKHLAEHVAMPDRGDALWDAEGTEDWPASSDTSPRRLH